MNTKRILGLGFLVVLSACKGECSCGTDDGDSSGVGGGTGGSDVVTSVNSTGTSGDGGAGGGTGGGAGGEGGAPEVVDATIRFAHLIGNATGVNFCVDGETAVEGGLDFKSVSEWGQLPPGDYSVGIVDDEAASCDDATLVGDITLSAGGFYTIAAIGDFEATGVTAAQIIPYDETDALFPESGSVSLRLVHAAPAAPVPVDVGEYAGEQFVPHFLGVGYTESAPNAADPDNDDPVIIPSDPGFITLVAQAAGTGVDSFDQEIELTDGAIITGYALGISAEEFEVFTIVDVP